MADAVSEQPTGTVNVPPVRTYQVQAGDTLASIADENGLALETLLWANRIDDPALLHPDQALRIPASDGLLYTLEPGDTLRDVASRFQVPLADIIASNPLDNPDRVPTGSEVLVPGASPGQFAVHPEANEGLQQASVGSTGLRSGVSKPPSVEYRVQPGDTLASLGVKFGIDLSTLLAANNIGDPDTVNVGTTLRILPVSGLEHEVQAGERLADIAARYQTLLGLIVDFNGIGDPDLVRPGDRLVIPGGRRDFTRVSSPPAAAVAEPARPARAAQPPASRAAAPPPAPTPAAASAQPKSAAVSPPSGPIAQRIASIAQQFNGAAYAWGGTSPSGFDCSGLVWYVAKQAGAPISRGLWGQYDAGPHISRVDLQVGDLVFFQNTYMPGLSHNGIYLGGGRFVHAVDESSGVRISNIDDTYWVTRWFGATRVG